MALKAFAFRAISLLIDMKCADLDDNQPELRESD